MRAPEPTVLTYGRVRREPLAPGHARDTALYSVLAAEWPGVRDGLRSRLPG